jgi:hypothetical protein
MNCSALLLLALLAGQAPAKQEGILQPWEAKPVVDQIQKDTRSLIDALGQLSTDHWKGDYSPLLLSTRQRVLDVADALDRLARKPESLVLAIDALLSMQHIEGNVDSLARGAERFQPTAVVPLDQGTNVFVDARGRMQTYVMDLARYTEKNLVSATNDLASCRDQLWKRPPPVPSPVRRK